MDSAATGIPDRRSPRWWRPRDEAILAFLGEFVATTEQIARLFSGRSLATRKKKASRWVVRQRRRRKLTPVGIVQRRDTGRPEIVYGRRQCKQREIEHEVRITDLALHFRGNTFTRGVKVAKTESDAFMIRDGNRCYLEVDNSQKMTLKKQMKSKFEKYQGVDGYVLVVSLTEARMERLRKAGEPVKDIALFNTFDRLRDGKPWVDWYGRTVTI